MGIRRYMLEQRTKNCLQCGKPFQYKYKWSEKQWARIFHCSLECGHKSKRNPPDPNRRKNIAFVWQGVSNPKIKEQWNDGLREAMRIVAWKNGFNVSYHEPWEDIVDKDIILYWEAPITAQGQNAGHYNKVRNNSLPKILLFAGGPIKREHVKGFDLLLLESKINEGECDALGIPWMHAFGINDKCFVYNKKEKPEKFWDGMLAGTCASWKRQQLIGEALGEKALLMGRDQESDPMPFRVCREKGATVMGESSSFFVAKCLRESWTCVNPCEFWGGGQRATLEAMAVGTPVVVCNDSPKNKEFVEESGFGRVVDPSAPAIKLAVEELKANPPDPMIGVNYVQSKWTAKIYADQIIQGINKVLNK